MGFYLAPNGIDEPRLASVVPEMAFGSKHAITHAGAVGWAWVDDDPDRFGPAFDERTGVTVISSGRLAWSAREWSRAADLPFRGGTANRLILERFLAGGAAGVTPYNGAVAIAVIDPRSDKLHVWTDQFGYHPCFVYLGDSPEKCIFTTFPDAVLADKSARLSYDLVSMAEFVRAWRTTPPHTYFNEVKHVAAASHTVLDRRAKKLVQTSYWRPFEEPFFPSIDSAAEELALAARLAIEERTAIAQRPLFFVSGGSDSRVLLFNAADPGAVTALNLYEQVAQETLIARELCARAGCDFVALQRDNDFYPRNLAASARWSGAMWSTEDSHYSGFADSLTGLSPDLVMTACTTDWLFKGYGLEKQYRSVLGRNLPIMRYLDERVDAFLPNRPLASPARFAAAIDQRLGEWFAGCPRLITTPRERLLIEDRRIRPTAYTVSVSGSIMYRNFPYDTFLADSRVAGCYSRIHPDWKLNREVWGKTVARLTARAGKIVDSNFGWRVDASTAEKLVVFARGWLSRRMVATTARRTERDTGPPSSGSWPELGWYALHSPTLKQLWDSVTPEERERMSLVCATDPWEQSLAGWSADGHYLFRVLTLLCHWRETDQRRARRLVNSG